MEYKLLMKPEQVIESAENMVKYAKKYVSDIEFSAEDATRSDVEFLAEIFDKVIKAGATTINIPDTVGYTTPEEYFAFLTAIREKCPALDNVDISVHCHNDRSCSCKLARSSKSRRYSDRVYSKRYR